MKKILSVMAVLALSASVMTGCGADQTQMPTQQTQTATQNATQTTADTSDFIGEARAQEIALERAGITADDVIFDRIELDRDNGIWQYEVEFRRDRTEYDVNIKADDGTVISYETDID